MSKRKNNKKNSIKGKQKINNSKYIIIHILSIIVLLLCSTLAYFIAIDESKNISITTELSKLVYSDNNDTITVGNLIPIKDEEMEEKASKVSFSMENTGTSTLYSDISITNIRIDEELVNLDFKWALYNDNGEITHSNFRNIHNNKILLTKNIKIKPNQKFNYILYMWISENGDDQNYTISRKMNYKITITGTQKKGYDLLLDTIKNNNNILNDEPDFSKVAVSQEYYDTLTEDTEVKKSNATVESGLYTGKDEDGDTYYFRGVITNNYVKFNNSEYLWRIVRVNGDNTIRLILDRQDTYVNTMFSQSYNDAKYVGYTYDNSAPNAGDGTPSTIKTYLDNWYDENISSYDHLIASTRYCNDTSFGKYYSINSKTAIYYGAYSRLVNDSPNPTFICPETTNTYGGEYDLKIGLLSADEAVFAGAKYDMPNLYYYLNHYKYFWVSSPFVFDDIRTHTFYVNNRGTLTYTYNYYGSVAALPVINLKSSVTIKSGNGSSSNPYVIAEY